MVRVSIAVIKHHGPGHLDRKGFICLQLHITVHHQRKQEYELKLGKNVEAGVLQRSWKNVAYCFSHHGFLSLLSYGIQNQQFSDSTIHNRLAPLILITKKMTYELAYSSILIKVFSFKIYFEMINLFQAQPQFLLPLFSVTHPNFLSTPRLLLLVSLQKREGF